MVCRNGLTTTSRAQIWDQSTLNSKILTSEYCLQNCHAESAMTERNAHSQVPLGSIQPLKWCHMTLLICQSVALVRERWSHPIPTPCHLQQARKSGPEVMSAGELVLPLTGYNAQASRPWTLPGQHNAVDPFGRDAGEQALMEWEQESWPHHPLSAMW